jgi:hypothetical protein
MKCLLLIVKGAINLIMLSDDIKKLLLGCSRAHIFYLYPTLCKAMVSNDTSVAGLIGEMLEVAGQAMGLGSDQ